MFYTYYLPYKRQEIANALSLNAKKCNVQNLSTSNCYIYNLTHRILMLCFISDISNHFFSKIRLYAFLKESDRGTKLIGLFGVPPVMLVTFPLIPLFFSLLWGNIGTAVVSFILALGSLIFAEILVNIIPMYGKEKVLEFIENKLKGVRLGDNTF